MSLNEAVNNDEKAELAIKVAESREGLVQWNQRLTGPMSNTCEQISEDARLEYITSCIIVDSNDGRVWKSHDDFLSVKDQAMSMKSRYEVMLYLQGYDSNFFEQTPEAIAMKEIELDILDEVNKTMAAEDDEIELVVEDSIDPAEFKFELVDDLTTKSSDEKGDKTDVAVSGPKKKPIKIKK